MMRVWLAPASVAILAFVTTVHAAFVVLRRHRSARSPLAWLLLIPGAVLALSPWVFSTIGGLVVGLVAQVAYFAACEQLTPRTRRTAAHAQPGAVHSRRSREFVPVPVLAIRDETPTIRTFRLGRPPDFSFLAGQFLTIRVDIDGKAHARCYSISSAPESLDYLEISVRRQGLVSGALHASVRPGAVVFVKPPAGRFVYPADDVRPLVLIAGGVGITPVLSMLRHAVAVDPTRPVTLLLSCRSHDDVPFADELALLAARYPQLRVVVTITGPRRDTADARDAPPRAVKPRMGHIDHALLREMVATPAGSLFYMCGPTPMTDAMRALLVTMGVPPSQIRTEVFQAAAAIGARAAQAAGEPAAQPAKVVCTRSNLVFEVAGSATLLEAADAAGVRIASLCRSGVCGTCRTRLVSGDVRCTSDALDERDRADGYILPCVSWPSGDCALEV